MSDPILVVRLRALWDDLDFVSNKLKQSAWLSEQSDTRAEMLIPALWAGLSETLIKEIEYQKRVLSRIMASVTKPKVDADSLEEAWRYYEGTFVRSQSILRECFEIIGTLAIRNNDLDEQVLVIADELVSECLVLSTHHSHYYLLVPGVEDTFSKTVSRIIRLRFPEWTIWHLPLVAHELGHVIVSETLEEDEDIDELFQILKPLAQYFSDSLAGLDGWQKQDDKVEATELDDWAADRFHEFSADAFATYLMGPAYACSAILLRLDPGMDESEGRPSDAQRAHVILSMLRWMSNQEGVKKPYQAIIDKLQKYWSESLKRVNEQARLTPEYEEKLDEFTRQFGENKDLLRDTALYTGVNRAWTLVESWRKPPDKSASTSEPDHIFEEKLRDVLNAAWILRLEVTDTMEHNEIEKPIEELKQIHEIGRRLCQSIIASKRTTRTSQWISSHSRGEQ